MPARRTSGKPTWGGVEACLLLGVLILGAGLVLVFRLAVGSSANRGSYAEAAFDASVSRDSRGVTDHSSSSALPYSVPEVETEGRRALLLLEKRIAECDECADHILARLVRHGGSDSSVVGDIREQLELVLEQKRVFKKQMDDLDLLLAHIGIVYRVQHARRQDPEFLDTVKATRLLVEKVSRNLQTRSN